MLHEDKPTYTIDEIKSKVTPVAKKYGVKKIWLFGSYARGEANSKSDIDFLIDEGKGKIRSLLTYFAFVIDLEDELKCHVDVVMNGSSDKNFLAEIKKEEVLLYAE